MLDIEKVIDDVKASTLPYESWEKLTGESALAFSAFCSFRDLGAERNIRKAVDVFESDESKKEKRYRVWRNWAAQFRWRERAADYDNYIEQLKQTELRKTIEAQGEKHRLVTGKMLDVVQKKLDIMNPEELTQGNVTDWVQTAIRAEREAAGLVSFCSKEYPKQNELSFVSDFNGL